MSALEDRIRAALNADRPVPDLWDAVQRGASRRRARRTALLATGAVLAVALIGTGIAIGGRGAGQPEPMGPLTPTRSETQDVARFPGADETVWSVSSAGDRVLVLTQSRTLWTLADGEWTAQRDLRIPDHTQYVIAMAPNGLNGVIHPFFSGETTLPISPGPSRDFLVTSDGGRTWTRSAPPTSCGCGATATDAGFFYLGMDGLYKSADGVSNWQRTSADSQSGTLPPYVGALFARGDALVVHKYAGGFAVSSDDGSTWRELPDGCRTAGPGYRHAYGWIFNVGIAPGEEIVEACRSRGLAQVMHTVDLSSWEHLGPGFESSGGCCTPISDAAAVGRNLLVTDTGVRDIDLPADDAGMGAFAARAGAATYLDYFGHLLASNDDGLTWTQLTR